MIFRISWLDKDGESLITKEVPDVPADNCIVFDIFPVVRLSIRGFTSQGAGEMNKYMQEKMCKIKIETIRQRFDLDDEYPSTETRSQTM